MTSAHGKFVNVNCVIVFSPISIYLSIYISTFVHKITLLFQLRLSSSKQIYNNYHATSNMHNTYWCSFVILKGVPQVPLYSKINDKDSISHLTKIKVRDQRNLVQQTVGHCCSGQACHGGLVRYPGQEDVQVVFESAE